MSVLLVSVTHGGKRCKLRRGVVLGAVDTEKGFVLGLRGGLGYVFGLDTIALGHSQVSPSVTLKSLQVYNPQTKKHVTCLYILARFSYKTTTQNRGSLPKRVRKFVWKFYFRHRQFRGSLVETSTLFVLTSWANFAHEVNFILPTK